MVRTSKRAWAVALTLLFLPIGCAAYQQPELRSNHKHIVEDIRVPPILQDSIVWMKTIR
jgi:hypothetical protein